MARSPRRVAIEASRIFEADSQQLPSTREGWEVTRSSHFSNLWLDSKDLRLQGKRNAGVDLRENEVDVDAEEPYAGMIDDAPFQDFINKQVPRSGNLNRGRVEPPYGGFVGIQRSRAGHVALVLVTMRPHMGLLSWGSVRADGLVANCVDLVNLKILEMGSCACNAPNRPYFEPIGCLSDGDLGGVDYPQDSECNVKPIGVGENIAGSELVEVIATNPMADCLKLVEATSTVSQHPTHVFELPPPSRKSSRLAKEVNETMMDKAISLRPLLREGMVRE
uniref:Uncharacterized protein n=1 Tax=Ananas comosus var. bracteatus TaxID=296719 RepID=A0A6V7PPY0_ANACO|nr:unnamed protein product [Ananas comosus var. bracteatus]